MRDLELKCLYCFLTCLKKTCLLEDFKKTFPIYFIVCLYIISQCSPFNPRYRVLKNLILH